MAQLLRAKLMYRLSAILLYITLALSVALGSVAHAAEGATCLDYSATSAAEHAANDSDQVPSDSEKAYPHHHAGCHGHDLGAPVRLGLVEAVMVRRANPHPWDSKRMARAPVDRQLRPPIA